MMANEVTSADGGWRRRRTGCDLWAVVKAEGSLTRVLPILIHIGLLRRSIPWPVHCGGPDHQNASKYQSVRIPGRLIQAPDPQDLFFRFPQSALSASANPRQPLLAFPFSEAKSCRSFNPRPISISSLAVAVKGLDANGLTWFSRHQS